MRALKDGGVLSVTLWNKEEPPKSVLKLYATMAAAAREVDERRYRQSLLRRVELSLDRDRALQARRLRRRGDRQAARAYARHVVRRDLLSRLRIRRIADRQGARGLPEPDLLRRRTRESDPTDEPTPDGDAAGRTLPPRRARTGKSRRRGARDHHGPAGLAPSRPRRLGRHRRALRVRHPPAHQQAARTSRPM